MLRPVATIATVNTIVVSGEDLVARFPLLPAARAELEAEATSMSGLTTLRRLLDDQELATPDR